MDTPHPAWAAEADARPGTDSRFDETTVDDSRPGTAHTYTSQASIESMGQVWRLLDSPALSPAPASLALAGVPVALAPRPAPRPDPVPPPRAPPTAAPSRRPRNYNLPDTSP